MSILVSHFVGGLDATRELERQISLVLNNLFHLFDSSSLGGRIGGKEWKETNLYLRSPNGDHWEVERGKRFEVTEVSFWYQFAKEKSGPNIRYLRWTRKTNHLWMRDYGDRPQVVHTCHSALQDLIDNLCKRAPELEELMLPYTRLQSCTEVMKKSQ